MARAAASRSGQGGANLQRSMDVDATGIRQEEGRDAGVRRPNAAAASDVPKVGWWPYRYAALFAVVHILRLHPIPQLRLDWKSVVSRMGVYGRVNIGCTCTSK